MKFHVLSFASEAKDIVTITETEISGDPEQVIWKVTDFDHTSRSLLVFFHSYTIFICSLTSRGVFS